MLKSLNGVDGRLELLQDSRLDESLRSILWNGAAVDSLPTNHFYWQRFKDRPPQPAMIRVVDENGTVLEKMSFERPLAKCERIFLYPNKFPTFLLAVDYSIGMGSYAGPATSLVEIAGGALRIIEALDDTSKQREPIRLMRALKREWKLVSLHAGTTILSVSCHIKWPQPPGGTTFAISFSRYQHDGKQWVRYSKTEEGLWESDQPFPPASVFP